MNATMAGDKFSFVSVASGNVIYVGKRETGTYYLDTYE